LLDIDSLDDAAVRALQSFCQAGGGLAYFLGPKSSLTFYNTLFGSGQGIFPVELEQPVDVEEDPQSTSADFLPLDHPIFAPVLHQSLLVSGYSLHRQTPKSSRPYAAISDDR